MGTIKSSLISAMNSTQLWKASSIFAVAGLMQLTWLQAGGNVLPALPVFVLSGTPQNFIVRATHTHKIRSRTQDFLFHKADASLCSR